MTQPPDDSFVGRDLWELFPVSSATNLREIMQDVLDTGEEARFRFYGRELGSWFDVRVRPAQGSTIQCRISSQRMSGICP